MPLADLIDQNALRGYLADLALSPAELGKLPALAAAASASVRAYCRRDFTSTDREDVYTVSPPGRTLVLDAYPVVRVSRVATGLAAVVSVTNDDPSNRRAAVELTAAGVLVLSRRVAGVRLADSVDLADLVDPTAAGLAAAVNAAGHGWRAEAAAGLGDWPAADLAGPQGPSPASGGQWAELVDHLEDLTFGLDAKAGILFLGPDTSAGSDSAGFGPAFGSEAGDVVTYGGRGGVLVAYTAGYETIPADVVQAVAEVAKAALERLGVNTSLQSESDGVLSWTARPGGLPPIPDGIKQALSVHVNRRA